MTLKLACNISSAAEQRQTCKYLPAGCYRAAAARLQVKNHFLYTYIFSLIVLYFFTPNLLLARQGLPHHACSMELNWGFRQACFQQQQQQQVRCCLRCASAALQLAAGHALWHAGPRRLQAGAASRAGRLTTLCWAKPSWQLSTHSGNNCHSWCQAGSFQH